MLLESQVVDRVLDVVDFQEEVLGPDKAKEECLAEPAMVLVEQELDQEVPAMVLVVQELDKVLAMVLVEQELDQEVLAMVLVEQELDQEVLGQDQELELEVLKQKYCRSMLGSDVKLTSYVKVSWFHTTHSCSVLQDMMQKPKHVNMVS